MLEKLRYFREVVQQGSFSKAADECELSQSAISQQIASLERELGYPLLIRRHRSFVLSDAGEYFYQKICVLLDEMDQVLEECDQIAHPDPDILKIGILNGLESMFAPVLEEFQAQNMDLSIQLRFGDHEQLFQMLRKDEVDLLFTDQRRVFSEAYRNEVLCQIPWRVDMHPHQAKEIECSRMRHHHCIVLSSTQEEQDYFSDVLNIEGPYLKADSAAQAHVLALSGVGIYPCITKEEYPILVQSGKPMMVTLCCFAKIWNQKQPVNDLIDLMHKHI